MKKSLVSVVVSLTFLFAISIAGAAEVEDYSSTINVFKSSPETATFFENAYGYAVFPIIAKGGFVVGGSYGNGQVYQGGLVKGKSSVIKGSIGFQAGGEAFSEIIFFQDKRAYDEFTGGNFEFGATAQAVVITVGAQAQAGTTGVGAGASTGPKSSVQAKAEYVKGMATFVHAKGGLMYELSVGGQKFIFEPVK